MPAKFHIPSSRVLRQAQFLLLKKECPIFILITEHDQPLLPTTICHLLKNCYHGTQNSAGEDGRLTTLKLAMCCVMLDAQQTCLVLFFPPLLLQVSLLKRQVDSNGTGLLFWLRFLIGRHTDVRWMFYKRRSDQMSEVPSTKLGKRA